MIKDSKKRRRRAFKATLYAFRARIATCCRSHGLLRGKISASIQFTNFRSN